MFDPWVKTIPWRREWQLTTVFSPGEFHGQGRLVGYSPWGRKESDTTEQPTLSPTFKVIAILITTGPSPVTDTLSVITIQSLGLWTRGKVQSL